MKIQCDVCEKAPATVICCADEAALCAKCDVEVHAANKLASKHQRLLLQSLSNKLPKCDICQDKPAFIFCVEDRALFCKDCDEPIHVAGSLSANHQRFLATVPAQLVPSFDSSWAVDDLLEFTDFDSSDKKQSMEFGELEWLSDAGLFNEQFPHEGLAAAEVPQLPLTHASNVASYKAPKSYMSYKKPRIEVHREDDDDEHFTVPDLG
ncbi:unnamed protein product [Vicia faba]|uniref:B box-type domain-containing protein n=1 Tax=Vicia faba TaxID=3906 RepID=A0AAV1B1U7_VICFA|nr:unnamed protein product [Vicia faba]